MHSPLEVLYEDNHLLIVNKPARLITQGANPGDESLIQVAKEYIKHKYQKPGNVYLGVMSRLDSLVSGVVVLARTSKAAARLTEQFRERSVKKTYLAIVSGSPNPPQGTWTDWLAKDDRAAKMVIVSTQHPEATEAVMHYRVWDRIALGTVLEVELETGRKHQIRVQCARYVGAVLGDAKYGSDATFPVGIALHARRLSLTHPTTGVEITCTAPLPGYWPRMKS
jgi:23S rRNA pseudouridine1911/1915/1917 synthase